MDVLEYGEYDEPDEQQLTLREAAKFRRLHRLADRLDRALEVLAGVSTCSNCCPECRNRARALAKREGANHRRPLNRLPH